MNARRVHRPLTRGSKAEGIADPDAPPVFHVGPQMEWGSEVKPHPVDQEGDEDEPTDEDADRDR
jgi:hypothetical protein